MKVTRQRNNTERRLVITLARHERHLTKTEILARIKKQKNNIEIAKEFGANVYHEIGKKSAQFLYMIPAHDFHKKGDQITPAQVAELGDYVKQLREQPSEVIGHLIGNGTSFAVKDYLVGVDPAIIGEDSSAVVIFEGGRMVGKTQAISRAINKRADEIKPDGNGFYSPRLNGND